MEPFGHGTGINKGFYQPFIHNHPPHPNQINQQVNLPPLYQQQQQQTSSDQPPPTQQQHTDNVQQQQHTDNVQQQQTYLNQIKDAPIRTSRLGEVVSHPSLLCPNLTEREMESFGHGTAINKGFYHNPPPHSIQLYQRVNLPPMNLQRLLSSALLPPTQQQHANNVQQQQAYLNQISQHPQAYSQQPLTQQQQQPTSSSQIQAAVNLQQKQQSQAFHLQHHPPSTSSAHTHSHQQQSVPQPQSQQQQTSSAQQRQRRMGGQGHRPNDPVHPRPGTDDDDCLIVGSKIVCGRSCPQSRSRRSSSSSSSTSSNSSDSSYPRRRRKSHRRHSSKRRKRSRCRRH
jgi:hypothetical protein